MTLSPSDLQDNFQWKCYLASWSPVHTGTEGFFCPRCLTQHFSLLNSWRFLGAQLCRVYQGPWEWQPCLQPVNCFTQFWGIPVKGPFQSAGSSTLQLIQWTCSCSQLSTLEKKLISFQHTGSTTMAAVWIEKSCCWPAFRLLLLNSPTEQRHIKVSSDTPTWGTYYCIDKIVKNWRALKALSRTDIKKRPTN